MSTNSQVIIIDFTEEEIAEMSEVTEMMHPGAAVSLEKETGTKEKKEKKEKVIKEKKEKIIKEKKEKPEVPACNICTESYNKTTHKMIECACGYQACASCVKRYLLQSVHQPHCMNCRKEWKMEFIQETLPASFLRDEYRAMRETILFEEEKTYLPALQSEAERQMKVDAIQRDMIELQRIRECNSEKEDQLVSTQRAIEKDISDRLNVKQRDLYKWETKRIEKNTKEMIMKCPMGECRGFLDASYVCGLCAVKVCKSCSKELVDGHECHADDVATVEELKRSTKPCPKCHCRIYKTDGCDQMFCIQCHTAFSWNTGQVETGVIHNPHYFEALRAGNIHDPRHRQDHGGCGPIPSFRHILRIIQRGATEEQQLYIQHLYQQCVHHRQVTLIQLAVRDDRDVDRIAYLKGALDEKKFKQRVYVAHQKEKRMVEERQILDSYVTIGEELFRTMRDDNMMEFLQQYNTLRQVTFTAIFSLDKKYQHKGMVSTNDIIEQSKNPYL